MNHQRRLTSRKFVLRTALAVLVLGLVSGVVYGGWRLFNRLGPLPSQKEPTTESTVLNSEQAIEPQTEQTSDWRLYRNEEYGFQFEYPPHLQIQNTLFPGRPFDPGIEGFFIISFSDGQTDELGVAISDRSLDRYILYDNPDGVFYRFNRAEGRWISSIRGEITGREPKLLDSPIAAYEYRSSDVRCLWHGVIMPHPEREVVLNLIYSICRNNGQHFGSVRDIPNLNSILPTFRFIDR